LTDILNRYFGAIGLQKNISIDILYRYFPIELHGRERDGAKLDGVVGVSKNVPDPGV
jgi:hypothetical protein